MVGDVQGWHTGSKKGDRILEFVWSDELAQLLTQEDGIDPDDLAHWVIAPVGYRLPEGAMVLDFARELLAHERWLDSPQAM